MSVLLRQADGFEGFAHRDELCTRTMQSLANRELVRDPELDRNTAALSRRGHPNENHGLARRRRRRSFGSKGGAVPRAV